MVAGMSFGAWVGLDVEGAKAMREWKSQGGVVLTAVGGYRATIGLDGELKRFQAPLDYHMERDALRLVVAAPGEDE